MKKLLILGFLVTVLITPSVVSAQSNAGSLSELLNSLVSLISRLGGVDQTAQLGGITAPAPLVNLKLLAPNGGETFYLGGTIPIRWSTVSTYSPSTVAHFYLVNVRGEYVRNLGSAALSRGLATSLTIPTNLPVGSYKVVIGSSNATSPSTPHSGLDSSDGWFAIKSTASTLEPNAEFTLLSKSITTSGVPQINSTTNQSTSTIIATFTVRMKAVGGDVMFGGPASTTALFANNFAAATNGTRSFVLYFNGAASSSLTNSTSTMTATDYAVSPGGLVDNSNSTFTLPNGSSVDIVVTYLLEGRMGIPRLSVPLQGGSYSVGLERINWVSAGKKSTRYPANLDWRTVGVSFP